MDMFMRWMWLLLRTCTGMFIRSLRTRWTMCRLYLLLVRRLFIVLLIVMALIRLRTIIVDLLLILPEKVLINIDCSKYWPS